MGADAQKDGCVSGRRGSGFWRLGGVAAECRHTAVPARWGSHTCFFPGNQPCPPCITCWPAEPWRFVVLGGQAKADFEALTLKLCRERLPADKAEATVAKLERKAGKDWKSVSK